MGENFSERRESQQKIAFHLQIRVSDGHGKKKWRISCCLTQEFRLPLKWRAIDEQNNRMVVRKACNRLSIWTAFAHICCTDDRMPGMRHRLLIPRAIRVRGSNSWTSPPVVG